MPKTFLVSDTMRRASTAVCGSQVLTRLQAYSPAVVSTVFVELDTPESDIDIVCSYGAKAPFLADFGAAFRNYEAYRLHSRDGFALGRFRHGGFLFEIYASTLPVERQAAYRHFQVMRRLVDIGGEPLKEKIRAIKATGLKTEPAICRALGLPGEPYAEVLELEQWPQAQLRHLILANSS